MRHVLLIFTVLVSAKMGLSIRCYECNSHNNSMCLDLASYDQETVNNYVRLTECTNGVQTADQPNFFCRKIVQTILLKHHDAEVRVNRGCGWVAHHRECYKADNEDHLETVCQCFTDGCNGATVAQLSSLAMFVAVASCFSSIASSLMNLIK